MKWEATLDHKKFSIAKQQGRHIKEINNKWEADVADVVAYDTAALTNIMVGGSHTTKMSVSWPRSVSPSS
jgi:hypothetical protein